MTLESEQHVQLSSNALEAARLVANKHLERELINNYHLTLFFHSHTM
jgi:ribosomal protein L16/L10AE